MTNFNFLFKCEFSLKSGRSLCVNDDFQNYTVQGVPQKTGPKDKLDIIIKS